jgi:GST-like protein
MVRASTLLLFSSSFVFSRSSPRITKSPLTLKMSTESTTPPPPTWTPPAKIEELYSKTAGNQFASINRPTAGARAEVPLPEGTADIQLYSLGTPNGQKVSILLEELGVDYDAYVINIGKGDQFGSGFVAVNPNSKIPALVDKKGPDGAPVNLFESASMMLYLAEKYGRFIPTDPRQRAEVFNWLFWQMGGLGPMCGNFGHFFVYAPADQVQARDYGVARYGMEVQRLCHVLELHLSQPGRQYLVGDEPTIADFASFPWALQLRRGYKQPSGLGANEFLSFDKYTAVNAWIDRLLARPAVERGLTVCTNGKGKPWLETQESK